MDEKFIITHDNSKGSLGLTFEPFGQGERKSKTIAIKFRNFLRGHMSATQYDEILKELSKDMKVLPTCDNLTKVSKLMTIVPKK